MKILKWFIYLCVFLFLIVLLLPNYVATYEPAKPSSVKANAHTLKTVLETYAADWGGQYPTNIKNLKLEASGKGYWKDFKNPFDYNAKPIIDFSEVKLCIKSDFGEIGITNLPKGTVIYEPIKLKNVIIKYFLYASSKEDNSLILDKGQFFYLSNN